MRKWTVLFLIAAAIVAVPAGAATKASTYKGQATSLDRTFKFGKVTIKRTAKKVTYVEIKAVTAYCSGQPLLRTIVFKDGDPEMKVVSGSSRIKGGKMKVTFLPVADIEDAKAEIEISFSGKRASGKFQETGLCGDSGRFTAKQG
jgi:hypothetical protein